MAFETTKAYLKNGASGAAIGAVAVAGGIAGAIGLGADMHAVNSVLSNLNLVSVTGDFVAYDALVGLGVGVGASAGLAKRAIQDKIQSMVERRVEQSKDRKLEVEGMEPSHSTELDVETVREAHYAERFGAVEKDTAPIAQELAR